MRTIKQKEGTGIKRVNINVPIELHNRFKASTAAQGLEMTVVLLAFIEGYVAKHGSYPAEEGTARMTRAALYMRVSTLISIRRRSSSTCARWLPSAASTSFMNTPTRSPARRPNGQGSMQ